MPMCPSSSILLENQEVDDVPYEADTYLKVAVPMSHLKVNVAFNQEHELGDLLHEG